MANQVGASGGIDLCARARTAVGKRASARARLGDAHRSRSARPRVSRPNRQRTGDRNAKSPNARWRIGRRRGGRRARRPRPAHDQDLRRRRCRGGGTEARAWLITENLRKCSCSPASCASWRCARRMLSRASICPAQPVSIGEGRYGCDRIGRAERTGADDSACVKHQDARPRRRKGQLDCGESPGRIVRIRAAARDEVEVERQRHSRVGQRHRFRKRDHLPAARGGGRTARSDSKDAHVHEPRRQAQDLPKGRERHLVREPGGLDDLLVRKVLRRFGGLLEDALLATPAGDLFDGLD